MSKPLVYVLTRRFKNKIVSIIKKPGQSVFLFIFIALFAFSLFSGNRAGITSFVHPFDELLSICLLLFGISFVLTSFSGISKGASLFYMSDVNLLFTSPTKPVSVLIYGLIQQMGTSLLLGAFILFQYSTVHSLYGVDVKFLIAVFLLYAAVSFCGQLTAMVIYILTSSDDKKIKTAKYSFISIMVLAVGAVFAYALSMGTDDMIGNIIKSASSVPVMFFPVIGWAKMILTGLFAGETINLLYVILGIGLMVVYVLALVLLIKFRQIDYYEDVLKATEISFSAITAKKEGKFTEAVPQNVKVGKTGIGKGNGSDVFFYKHKLESRRIKAFVFDIPTLVYMAVICIFAFVLKSQGVLPIILLSVYLQIFSVALGRWTKELILPYVYLIPEKPMKKLFNCLKESFSKLILEAILLFAIVGLIMKLEPMEIVGCILIRISFGILFTAVNIFCERFFGGISVKIISLMLYFLFSMIFATPAILTGMGLYLFTLINESVIYIISALINTAFGFIALFVSRNVLQYAELNNR